MMLAKAACLVAASTGYVLCSLPPPSSKSVDAKKDDKILHENWLTRLNVNKFPVFLALIGALETLVYLVLMFRGPTFSSDIAIQQLQELKTWHIVLTVLAVSGCILRRWSFATLDRFFTYQLTIRSGHKLVQSGPYTFLRHPSYTGALLNSVSMHVLLLNDGLFDVFMLLVSRTIALVTDAKTSSVSLPNSFFGLDGGVWLAVIYAYMIIRLISVRVRNEEGMLKEHFGKDWDVYASKRWRFIPFVY